MVGFSAVRAKWDSAHSHCDDSLTLPLLRPSEASASEDVEQKSCSAVPSSRRLNSGLGVFNKPLTTIRNKAFSRASRSGSSGSLRSGGFCVRDMQSEEAGTLVQANVHGRECGEKMARSLTMSFLPVPVKPSVRQFPKHSNRTRPNQLSTVAETSIPGSRQTSFRRVTQLPRATTQPNLGSAVVESRSQREPSLRSSSLWTLTEDTKPLLTSPSYKTPMLGSPTHCEERFMLKSTATTDQKTDEAKDVSPTNQQIVWSVLDSPPLISCLNHGKENIRGPDSQDLMCLTPPKHSPHVIQHHQLLQPIHPSSQQSNNALTGFSSSSMQVSSRVAKNTLLSASPSCPVLSNLQTPQRLKPLQLSPTSAESIHRVYTAQSNAYWSGRFVSLNDKLLNDSFDVETRPTHEDDAASSASSAISAPKMVQETVHQTSELKRVEKIFQQLEELCFSDEARRSLLIFRNMYALRSKMPGLRCEIPPKSPTEAETKEEMPNSSLGNGTIGGGLRKMSLMAIWRGRKISGKSNQASRD
ncbi:uncharacterized protein PV09_01292 [Verruconis gallopava]|uniref:Uncharacterized protein n=1 Tax=Verruconis gallopava TaxID=253628 RepID=A0A0D1XZY3_9PEZI|nr:uncharacterized protein PV09_01292 [Verruconis gallopava]KIW08376.1 hypothetical protein PV09_01292 [Verruconis gallopava]